MFTTARVGGEYDFEEVSYNYRMTNIQEAIGALRWSEFIAPKRYIREYYERYLCDVNGISFFPESPWGKEYLLVVGDCDS